MPAFTCLVCGRGFHRPPSYLQGCPQPKCCSNPCKREAQARGLYVLQGPRSRRRRYTWEPWQDELLRRTYTGTPGDGPRLAAQLRRPRHAILQRAQRLGLSKGSRPWTPQEETYLRRWIGRRSLTDIARHLRRSRTAVQLKGKRLHVSQYGLGSPGYTARAVARQFAVDVKVVTHWIQQGMLQAQRRETARTPQQGGDAWLITETALRDFVLAYPEKIDLRRLEPVKDWFLDLVTDGAMTRRALQARRS